MNAGKLTSPLPLVTITPEAWTDLCTAVRACATEISALGLGWQDGLRLHVEEVKITKQVSSIDANETDDAWLAQFLNWLVTEGGGAERWIMQQHSHPGSVYCSDTDLATIAGYTAPAFLSLVMNPMLDYHLQLNIAGPNGLPIVYELDLHLQLPFPDANRVTEICTDVGQLVRVGRRQASPRTDLASQALPPIPIPRGRYCG